MLEIAKSNGETSNNSVRLVIATLIVNIARLAATTLTIPVIAAFLRLIAFIVLIIAALLRRSAYKAIRGRAASSTS